MRRLDVTALDPFRCDIGRTAGELAGRGVGRLVGGGRDPEVGQHHPPAIAEVHVARLHVAVHKTHPVDRPKRLENP